MMPLATPSSRPPLLTPSATSANLPCTAIRTINWLLCFVKCSHLFSLPEPFSHSPQHFRPLATTTYSNAGVLILFLFRGSFETLVTHTNLFPEKNAFTRDLLKLTFLGSGGHKLRRCLHLLFIETLNLELKPWQFLI